MKASEMYHAGAAAKFYEKLRDINPHLPDPSLVVPQFELHTGEDEMSVLCIEVYVKLPVEES